MPLNNPKKIRDKKGVKAMGISIDMNRALTSEAYAAQCIRSGQLSSSERSQIAAQWGADKIKLWEAVDSTDYRIEDDDWNASIDAGRKKAEEATGHDGSKESILKVGTDVLGAGLSTTGAIALTTSSTGGIAGSLGRSIIGEKATNNISLGKSVGEGGAEKNIGARATVIMASAVAAKYWLERPNKEQVEAAKQLYNAQEGTGILIDGQCSLNEAQELMQEASEETTALTEEAEELNDETNEDIDDNKTNFDFYRKQYEYLKEKAQRGEELTPDEKQMLKDLAPLMEEASANITTAQEEASTALEDKTEEIEAYQTNYDDSAETIAEVQGLTDFAEGFDSATRTMAYIEGGAQTLNGISAGRAAALLSVSGFWNIAFATMGYVAATASAGAAAQQFSWAGQVGDEIDFREATQDLGSETSDMYDEELDNFAGNLEIIDDLEVVVPEDLAIPNQPATAGDSGGSEIDPLAAGAAGVDVDENNGDNNGGDSDPLASGAAGQEVKPDEPKAEDDPNKKDEDEKK